MLKSSLQSSSVTGIRAFKARVIHNDGSVVVHADEPAINLCAMGVLCVLQ